jgi:hypothetical protein
MATTPKPIRTASKSLNKVSRAGVAKAVVVGTPVEKYNSKVNAKKATSKKK